MPQRPAGMPFSATTSPASPNHSGLHSRPRWPCSREWWILGAVPEKKAEEGIPTRIDIAGTWIGDPTVNGNPCPEASGRPDIGHWSAVPGVLAWKLAGAGGGGYLILAVEDSEAFSAANQDAVRITVRR